ncbi:hypothetical protein BDR07DRAFT_1048297 [Suillus spraguei]|nr:hypothetical protein BDR07DRAFT_1048297 [Suillus spraguei]
MTADSYFVCDDAGRTSTILSAAGKFLITSCHLCIWDVSAIVKEIDLLLVNLQEVEVRRKRDYHARKETAANSSRPLNTHTTQTQPNPVTQHHAILTHKTITSHRHSDHNRSTIALGVV